MTDARPVPGVNRRGLLIGGAMALTSAAAWGVQPRRAEHRLANRKLGSLIARQIGPWTVTSPGGVIVATEEVEDTDGYDQLLTRVYAAPGLPTVMLLIAYGSTQGGSLQLHRPETCYPGQGFKLRAFDDPDLPLAPGRVVQAREFTATRDERNERVLYWTRIANNFPRNTGQEYATIIRSVLTGTVPDGILVRVSTIGPDDRAATPELTRFAHAMIESASPAGRQVLIGG